MSSTADTNASSPEGRAPPRRASRVRSASAASGRSPRSPSPRKGSRGSPRTGVPAPLSVSPLRSKPVSPKKLKLGNLLPETEETILDTSGMQVVKPGDPAFVSLETFDPERTKPPFLTSPRSIEACLECGINAKELLKVPLETFLEDCDDDEIAQLRADHYETRRQEKFFMVCEARDRIMESNAEGDTEEDRLARREYDSVKATELKKEKLLRQNMAHAEACRSYDERMREMYAKTKKKMEESVQREIIEKHRQEQEAREKSEERARKHREHQEFLARMQKEQQDAAARKRAEMDEKDRIRREAMEQIQRDIMDEHARRRAENEERIRKSMDNQRRLEEEALRNFQEKQRQSELKRQELEARRQREKREAEEKAKAKADHIAETLRKNEEREKQRIARAKAKQDAADQRLRQRAESHEEWMERKRREDEEREAERQRKFEQARQNEEDMKRRTREKAEAQERAFQELKRRQDRERQKSLELQRLKELDREEAVARTKRQQEFNRMRTLGRVSEKKNRVEKLREVQKKMVEENLKNREVVEKNKVKYVRSGPAPGEFSGQRVWGRRSPAYGFGASPEQIKNRVISPSHTKAFYGTQSPAITHFYPYSNDALPRKPPSWSFGSEDRFNSPYSAMNQGGSAVRGPGPGAYSPDDRKAARGTNYETLQFKANSSMK